MNILLLDNYDSFTYNLCHYLQQFCEDVTVCRNDEITLAAVDKFSHIVLSPGPGLPKDAGILLPLVAAYAHKKPILGVCLGMQALAIHFGASLYNLPNVRHGIAMPIDVNTETDLFKDLPQRIEVGLYHSWAVAKHTLPPEVLVSATSLEGVCMALSHTKLPVFGVQFHPESVLTPMGKMIIKNWITATKGR